MLSKMFQIKILPGLYFLITITSSHDSIRLEQCSNTLRETFSSEFLQQYSIVLVTSNPEATLATFPPIRSLTISTFTNLIGHGSNFSMRMLSASPSVPSLYLICTSDMTILSMFFETYSSLMAAEIDYNLRDRRHIILLPSTSPSMSKDLVKLLRQYNQILQQDAFNYIIEIPQDFQHSVKFYEVYHIKNSVHVYNELRRDEIGTDLLRIEDRRLNMHQVHYNMVYQNHKDYVPWVLADEEGQVDMGITAGYNLVNALAYTFNLTYHIIPGTGYISLLPNGSLGGMGNQLVHYKADNTLNANELVRYRAQALSYTQPILTNVCEVFYQHLMLAALKNILIDAFQADLWIAIGLVGLGISLSWIAIVTISLKFDGESVNENELEVACQLTLLPIRILCLQGMSKPPVKFSLRIIFLDGMLVGAFIYILYSSYILSIFTADPNIFHSLYDFPRLGFELVAQSRSLTAEGILKQLSLELTKREDGMPSVEMDTAIRQVQGSRTALVTTPNYYFSTATNFSELQLCAFRSRIKVPAITDRSVIFFRKNDPLRTFYNYKIIAMIERGFIYRTQKEFNEIMQRPCRQGKDSSGGHILSVSELHTAFSVCIFGVVISISVLIIEKMVWRKYNYGKWFSATKSDYFL